MKDFFAVLSVKPSASADEIKAQYRKLSKLYHPDVNPDGGSKFTEINEAYETLSDPAKKREYLESIKKEKQQAQAGRASAQQQAQARAKGFNGQQSAQSAQSDTFNGYANASGDARLNFIINQTRQQSYKQGYDAASAAYSSTVSSLNNEVASLKAQLAAIEQRSRQNITEMSSGLSSQLKQETDKRIKLEQELSRIKAEHSALLTEYESVKQDLEVANDTIEELFSDPGFNAKSKAAQTDEDDNFGEDYDNEYYEEDYEETEDELAEQFGNALVSAMDGDPEAQNLVGEYYQYGTGVAQDWKAAFEWFTKSANNSDPDGLLNLGICYLQGEGTEPNRQLAEFYIRKSAYYGNEDAIQFCDEHGWEIDL